MLTVTIFINVKDFVWILMNIYLRVGFYPRRETAEDTRVASG